MPETFAAFAAQISGSVDVLVHNGGSGGYAPFGELTPTTFDEQIAIHFKGPLFLTQALLPKLALGSTIIQISSGLTRCGTSHASSVHAASPRTRSHLAAW